MVTYTRPAQCKVVYEPSEKVYRRWEEEQENLWLKCVREDDIESQRTGKCVQRLLLFSFILSIVHRRQCNFAFFDWLPEQSLSRKHRSTRSVAITSQRSLEGVCARHSGRRRVRRARATAKQAPVSTVSWTEKFASENNLHKWSASSRPESKEEKGGFWNCTCNRYRRRIAAVVVVE